jgi:hypothetical protein
MTRNPADETDRLIEQLSRTLRPVRPLQRPLLRALAWLAYAALVVAAIVAANGLSPHLPQQMARTPFVLEWAAAALTGILAAVAAFHLSLPDRSARWALLPLPALALWVASLGYGCLSDWLSAGPQALSVSASFDCFQAIVLTSLPLGVGLILMLRHAGPVRPTLTAFCGALAAAALAASGLSLYHGIDAAVMILVWHVGTAALIAAAATLAAPRLVRWSALRR